MEITLEKLNNLPYEQMLCIHIVMCSFVAQRQQELMESGMMDEEVIKMYRYNVEHLIPGSEEAFIQSTMDCCGTWLRLLLIRWRRELMWNSQGR